MSTFVLLLPSKSKLKQQGI